MVLRTTKAKIAIISVLLLLGLALVAFYYSGLFPGFYQNKITSDKPLVLQGDDILEIENTHYIQKNNIILKDHARLVITDSLFEHRQDFSSQYTLLAQDDAQIVVRNSEIRSSNWLNWNFGDRASLEFANVRETFSGIWHSFSGNAVAKVTNAAFRATLGGSSHFDIENSPDTFIEFVYPVGAIVDEELPQKITDYSFPNANDSNIGSNLHIKNSTASSWGITVNPKSTVTIRDANPLIVTLVIGEPLIGVTAELNDLKATRYKDQQWKVEDLSLRLINVTTGKWSPIVGGNNTLIVKNSDLADNSFSWGNAKVVIENSSASFLRAKDFVEMTVRDSVINGDVVVVDNGKITLINTTVKGKIVEKDNGKIIHSR